LTNKFTIFWLKESNIGRKFHLFSLKVGALVKDLVDLKFIANYIENGNIRVSSKFYKNIFL
jgi:hypothetical protein